VVRVAFGDWALGFVDDAPQRIAPQLIGQQQV
jgi:hypothetical protein